MNRYVPLLCRIDTEGRIDFLSPGWNTIVGDLDSPARVRCAWDILHPDDRPATQAVLARLAAGERGVHLQNRVRDLAGVYHRLDWSAKPLVRDGWIYAAAHNFTEDEQRGRLEPRHMRALLELADAMMRDVTCDRLVQHALRLVRRALRSEVVAMYELAPHDRALRFRTGVVRRAGRPLPDGDPLLVETAESIAEGPFEARSTGGSAARSDLTVAVRHGGVTFGVLAVARSAGDGFGVSERAFIRRVAEVLATSHDRGLRAEAATAVIARHLHIFEHNPNPMMIVHAETLRFLEVNKRSIELYGFTREQWLAMTPYDLRAPQHRDDLTRDLELIERNGSRESIAYHRKADGSRIDVHVSVVTTERDGIPVRIVTVQDMTELNEALRRSRKSEAALERAQHVAKFGDWSFEAATGEHTWSAEVFALLGLSPANGVPPGNRPFRTFVHPDDVDAVSTVLDKVAAGAAPAGIDHRVVRVDGEIRWVRFECTAEFDSDGTLLRTIVTLHDINSRKHAEEQLAYDALHDRLTGLPNRALFTERLQHTIERAKARDRMAAVLFLDLDGFKNVNDTLGHSAGDVLLRVVAERLRANTRQLDCISRMGGDEFIAVLGDISDAEHVAEIARNLGRVTADPVRIGDREISVTASIGVALYPRDGVDPETLVRDADAAMYQAKRDGRARTRFFVPAMHEAAEHRLRLEGRLRQAAHDGTFTLAYQPIYTIDGTLTGTEALLRWPQPDGTVALPGTFIPYAEESGLIVPIGAWVLRSACLQNAAWNHAGHRLAISVNVSGKQLADPAFAATVRDVLQETGLAPELLQLELTETVMSSNMGNNAAVVRELRSIGVLVAVDDFGTGYNSLATLRSYEIDTLKLDRCFVTDIAVNAVDRAIASAVIAAAHGLGAKVVAEGIETAEQHAVLTELDFDYGQGYLFARPMPAEQFGRSLRGETKRPAAATLPMVRGEERIVRDYPGIGNLAPRPSVTHVA